ncbi:MAG: transcription elongation factor GreA [Saprospiraceae bacterium]|jgi:transcription elongation factor GreA|nr:transcription elongation factor GreA [Saprospiraceae bacterium]MBP7923889.1 transcription elongation factor GreA [Saprospiraceae bacterium]MBP8094808.1 transcription elongation factor GreA [Saprospiraceae bacterium]MBP8941209.1 transcription elongation factor GreA [Saprospiraceae bacterium]MBP9744827.1 transcription elongation factor GreA [Saprospiraceae bacterium]
MELTLMTPEGFEKLKHELDELKGNGRQDASKAIAEAREKGDLSENAEYHAAKDAQGMLEYKINELEKKLANVKLVDESQVDISRANILSSVTIRNKKSGKLQDYKLVSEAEADLKSGKLSVASPIGKGIVGKKIGEIAEISTPNGTIEFEIINIYI